MTPCDCEMKPEQYEKVVSEFAKKIYELADSPSYGKDNQWVGASKHSHQIDVSFYKGDDLVFIECKCWNSNIPVEKALAFFARIHDIQPTVTNKIHGIIATTHGYQEGAKLFADRWGIVLAWVKSVDEFGVKLDDYTIKLGSREQILVREEVLVELVGGN